MGHIANSDLAIFSRIADVLRMRAGDIGELQLESVNDVPRLIEREGCLGEVGDAIGIGNLERLNFSHI
jgi:hypothetical protein